MSHDVVITGIGVVSSIGVTREEFWQGCLAGRSGAVALSSDWVCHTDLSSQIAAVVNGFDPQAAGLEVHHIRFLDRVSVFALAAAGEALSDAGFDVMPSVQVRGQMLVDGVEPERLAGYASNCDAHSMMQLDESGRSLVALMEKALATAGIAREDVDLVSAHGTSTVLNDRTEARALRLLFGEKADGLAVTALKSMTGHAIAASGPMEAAAACLGLRHGVMTPTINYQFPDPECVLSVVAHEPRRQAFQVCLKPSYGFGGHDACLVLTQADGVAQS
ncbi:MAG: hypothetical protein E2P00_07605 [Acidobacteria bacterium]|nr:MAG: hypothetical protein E2P00_07605 [Acidobacteriota bacterium]